MCCSVGQVRASHLCLSLLPGNLARESCVGAFVR